MSAPRLDTVRDWQGRTMVDPAGGKLGTITDIYLDDETGQPEWATVTTGLFGTKATFVALAQAQATGDSVQVPYDQDQVKDAPNMQPDGQLSQDDEAELYRHYGQDRADRRRPGRHGVVAGAEGHARRGRRGPGAGRHRPQRRHPRGCGQGPTPAQAAAVGDPGLTGAVLVVSARMGEQQRPTQVAGGLLGRLRPGRAA